jgi:hypothetical protein
MPVTLLRKAWGIAGDQPVSKWKHMNINIGYWFVVLFSWRF